MNNEKHNLPLIVGFVSDLMFTPRITNVVRHLNYDIKWIESPADLGSQSTEMPPETRGESLHGQEGQLFESLTTWQPALLLFDLNNNAIPWRRWIALLRSSAATRRIPILCFGSHMDVVAMSDAKNAGADAVLARSRFTTNMPDLIQQYAKHPDQEKIYTAVFPFQVGGSNWGYIPAIISLAIFLQLNYWLMNGGFGYLRKKFKL